MCKLCVITPALKYETKWANWATHRLQTSFRCLCVLRAVSPSHTDLPLTIFMTGCGKDTWSRQAPRASLSHTHTHSQTPVTPCGTWCACSRGLQWLRLQEITQLLITLSYNVSAGVICKHQTPLMKHSSLNPHLSISNTITQHALCAELNPQTRRQSWHKKQQVIIQISIQNSGWNIQKYHNKSTTGRWTLTELTRNDSSSDFMITATVRLITWSWK